MFRYVGQSVRKYVKVGKLFAHSLFLRKNKSVQVERDIMIWNNKKYEGKPMFVKSAEDSLVARHRRWYSQFYSEHSPRLSSAVTSAHQPNLDW